MYTETRIQKETNLENESFEKIEEITEKRREENFRKQLDSQNPLFDKRKYIGTNASFRSERKGIQANLNMKNHQVEILLLLPDSYSLCILLASNFSRFMSV